MEKGRGCFPLLLLCGALSTPRSGVAMAPDGGVFVADTNNNRVMHWPAEAISRDSILDTLRSTPNWTWAHWKPSIHRRWDFLSRRTVAVIILCQSRGSHPGLSSLGNILVNHVLPFVIPRRLIYTNAELNGKAPIMKGPPV